MNITRLILLNKRQWKENKRLYRTGLLAITGILSFLFLIVWHWRDSFSGDVNRGIFLIGLFGGGCILGSTMLKDLTHPSKGMLLISLPASVAEKLFIAIFYGIISYAIIFIAVFYLTEGFFLWLVKQDHLPIERTDLLHNGFYNFIFTFINFQLFILLGSISFKRAALLKTLLIMIVFFSLSTTGNNYLLMIVTGESNINGGGLFDYFQFVHKGENVYVYLPETARVIIEVFFHYLFPLILYYIIYLKFHETEL